jgi:hypothetical protein
MYERTNFWMASKTWAMTGWRTFASNPVLAPVPTRWITSPTPARPKYRGRRAGGDQRLADAAEMMKQSFLERDLIRTPERSRVKSRTPGGAFTLAERHRGPPHDRRQIGSSARRK